MKKIWIGAAVLVCALTGCFDGGNIAMVKAGVMDFDKSLKVGDAFGNWSECTQKNWSEIKTPNGRKIVQFECTSTKVHDFVQYGKAHFPDLFPADFQDIDATVTTFQWTINTDDTFELTSASRIYKWADGAVYGGSGGASAERRVKIVYSNVVEFDVAALQTSSGRSIASQQSQNLRMIRRFAPQVSPASTAGGESSTSRAANQMVDKTAISELTTNAGMWVSIQKSPQIYLTKCMEEERQGYIANGVNIPAPAVDEETRKDCTAKINDIKQCMGNPNAKVDACFDTANNTGD